MPPIKSATILAGFIASVIAISLLALYRYKKYSQSKPSALSIQLSKKMRGEYFHLEGTDFRLPYRIYIPSTLAPNEKYPLIVFLHGAGDNGDENIRQLGNTVAELIKLSESVEPTFVLAPQAPKGKNWVTISGPPYLNYSQQNLAETDAIQAIRKLITQLPISYPIDIDRIYFTGFSAGAAGTWDLLTRQDSPSIAAAAVMLSGAYDPSRTSAVINMPLWFFHGREDTISPFSTTTETVEALHKVNTTPKLSLYPSIGHDTNEQATKDGAYTWLLQQRRSAWHQ